MKHSAVILAVATVLTALPGCASKKEVTTADSIPGTAVTAITAESIAAGVVEDVIALNKDWRVAELSGKLRADGLPLSPTLKIYMERDSMLSISARAPFVGEAVRMDLTADSLFAVNKLKKIYCIEPAERLQEIYPTLCGELQSILLGRVVVPGRGELSVGNIDAVVITMEDVLRRLSVALGNIGDDLSLDWMVSPDGNPEQLLVILGDKTLLTLDYEWKRNGGYDIFATTTRKGSPFVVELDFDSPKWKGERPSASKIGSGYRRVTITDFIKSF